MPREDAEDPAASYGFGADRLPQHGGNREASRRQPGANVEPHDSMRARYRLAARRAVRSRLARHRPLAGYSHSPALAGRGRPRFSKEPPRPVRGAERQLRGGARRVTEGYGLRLSQT